MISLNRDKNNFYTDYDLAQIESNNLHYANFYIMENFLTNQELDDLTKLLDTYDEKTDKGTVIGYSAEDAGKKDLRDSNIFFLGEKETEFNQKFNQMILDRAMEINKNVFNLDLQSYMSPQYTIYKPAQHFNWHPDGPFGVMDTRGLNCIPKNLQWRKLSMSIMLNDGFEGGHFQLLNISGNPTCNAIQTFEFAKGTAILFPAFASHKVTPVISGVRKTLIYWFCGPRWR